MVKSVLYFQVRIETEVKINIDVNNHIKLLVYNRVDLIYCEITDI